MIFSIKVEKNAADWTVKILQGDTTIHSHKMRRIFDPMRGGFPLPPDDKVSGESSALTAPIQSKVIFETFNEIAKNTPRNGDVRTFGSYLFDSLIGETGWQSIVKAAAAGDKQIDLQLSWDDDDWELYRLPWEMMCRGSKYLASEPRVTITRIVSSDVKTEFPEIFHPKILFVIGSDLKDEKIRAGAEYSNLLQRVEKLNISICSEIISTVNALEIEDKIKSFKPTVVHFICHGGFDSGATGTAYLEVQPDTTGETKLYADSLIEVLKAGGSLPVVMVLNACYTATPPTSRTAPPLAVELVKKGIPVVVAMGGRVADTACRLFTRSFYESLHTNEPIPKATADGRRAGIKFSSVPPDNFIDWALPSIFIAENSPMQIRADDKWLEKAKRLEKVANKYRTMNNPKCFCDRFEILNDFRQILNTPIGKLPEIIVLAIEANKWKGEVKAPDEQKYGKTRLLEEMAARAVTLGHLPCLVTFTKSESYPTTALEIGLKIIAALNESCEYFKLDSSMLTEFLKLTEKKAGKDVLLHPQVKKKFDLALNDNERYGGKMVRAALQIDLVNLQNHARQVEENPALKISVLIDDVHKFGEGARELTNMLSAEGLGTEENPVPVAFAFSSEGFNDEENSLYITALKHLKEFVGEKLQRYVRHIELQDFRQPEEDWLPYQYFLLNREPPRIISRDKAGEMEKAVYQSLYEDTFCGVPSQLVNNRTLEAGIKAYERSKVLIQPSDSEWLVEIQKAEQDGNDG